MEFKQAIKMYLDVNAMQDAEFKAKYSNPNKNIDECCTYIQYKMMQKVLEGKDKEKTRAAVAIPTDEEVFALAVQYYMDDDLKIDGTEFDNVKVLSMQATSFTDEEKAQMRQEAIKKYQDDVIAEQKKKDDERRKKKEKKPTNPTIVPDVPAEKNEESEQESEKKAKIEQLSLF